MDTTSWLDTAKNPLPILWSKSTLAERLPAVQHFLHNLAGFVQHSGESGGVRIPYHATFWDTLFTKLMNSRYGKKRGLVTPPKRLLEGFIGRFNSDTGAAQVSTNVARSLHTISQPYIFTFHLKDLEATDEEEKSTEIYVLQDQTKRFMVDFPTWVSEQMSSSRLVTLVESVAGPFLSVDWYSFWVGAENYQRLIRNVLRSTIPSAMDISGNEFEWKDGYLCPAARVGRGTFTETELWGKPWADIMDGTMCGEIGPVLPGFWAENNYVNDNNFTLEEAHTGRIMIRAMENFGRYGAKFFIKVLEDIGQDTLYQHCMDDDNEFMGYDHPTQTIVYMNNHFHDVECDTCSLFEVDGPLHKWGEVHAASKLWRNPNYLSGYMTREQDAVRDKLKEFVVFGSRCRAPGSEDEYLSDRWGCNFCKGAILRGWNHDYGFHACETYFSLWEENEIRDERGMTFWFKHLLLEYAHREWRRQAGYTARILSRRLPYEVARMIMSFTTPAQTVTYSEA